MDAGALCVRFDGDVLGSAARTTGKPQKSISVNVENLRRPELKNGGSVDTVKLRECHGECDNHDGHRRNRGGSVMAVGVVWLKLLFNQLPNWKHNVYVILTSRSHAIRTGATISTQ